MVEKWRYCGWVFSIKSFGVQPSKMKIVSVRTAHHKKKLIVKQSAFKQYVFDAFSYLSSFNIQIRLRNGVENSDHDRIAQK